MTARQLAPEADLATVLQLATDALQRGTMLDPEELLCQLLGLDPAQLLEHLEDLDDFPPLVWETDPELRPPDRSPPASRARAREETMAERLEHRYEVRKVNDPTGKHDACRYFVLDPAHDQLARQALAEYARLARVAGHHGLADDLEEWLAHG